MDFQIGENVLLNNETYKIIGKVKRSFLLEKDGKNYKATANKMGKIQDQNSNGIGVDKNNFQIGENVLLNNKTYKITGTNKRSFVLERDGKKYRATSKMMGKIQDQNSGVGVNKKQRTKKSSTFYMERRLAYRKIFDAEAKMPETEKELMKELDGLCCELSPENLSCDGEISITQIRKKASAIRAEWKEIEKKLGRKVSEDEAESHWMSTYNNR